MMPLLPLSDTMCQQCCLASVASVFQLHVTQAVKSRVLLTHIVSVLRDDYADIGLPSVLLCPRCDLMPIMLLS